MAIYTLPENLFNLPSLAALQSGFSGVQNLAPATPAPAFNAQPATKAEAKGIPARYTNIEVVKAATADADQAQEPDKYFAIDSETGDKVELLKASEYPVGQGPEGTEWLARRSGNMVTTPDGNFLPFEALDSKGNIIGTWNMQKNELSDFSKVVGGATKAAAIALTGQALGSAIFGSAAPAGGVQGGTGLTAGAGGQTGLTVGAGGSGLMTGNAAVNAATGATLGAGAAGGALSTSALADLFPTLSADLSSLTSSFGNIGTGLSSSVGNLGTGLSSSLGNLGTGITSSVGNLGTGLSSSLGNLGTGINYGLTDLSSGLTGSLGNLGQGLQYSLGGLNEGINYGLTNLGSGLTSSIGELGTGLTAGVTNLGTQLGQGISTGLGDLGSGLGVFGTGLGSGLGELGTGLFSGISNLGAGIGELGTGLTAGITDLSGQLGQGLSNLGTGVGAGIGELGTGLSTGISGLGAGIGEGLGTLGSGIGTGISSLGGAVGDVLGGVTGLFGDLGDTVSNVLGGLTQASAASSLSKLASTAPLINALVSGGLTQDTINSLKNLGSRAQTDYRNLATEATKDINFTPYGVTTGLFGSRYDPTTRTLESTYQPGVGDVVNAAGRAALGSFDQAGTADLNQMAADRMALYQQLVSPEQQRSRLAQEARLQAQGRLGVGAGGGEYAPELKALEDAIAKQNLQFALAAPQEALAQRGALITQGQAASQVPIQLQQQQLAQLQLGGQLGQQQAQTAAARGGLFGQYAGQGISENVLAQIAAAQVASERNKALGTALGGLFV